MQTFTPLSSLAGGALIGIAVAFLMVLNGRIAGVSGITSALLSLSRPSPDTVWRAAFLVGLVLAPALLGTMRGQQVPIVFVVSMPTMALAGLLVGFGSVLGNGCTSGHGVCGLARLSVRSIVATVTFMAAGVITVYIAHHLLAGA